MATTRSAPWPELAGAEEDLERAAWERGRCARLMLEWSGPAGLDREVAAAVRARARALLETRTEAAYWRDAGWRRDVFGWSSALWGSVKWEPENGVGMVVEVQRPQAELWGLAAWAEGMEVAEWVGTCASTWVVELGRVADEARRGKTAVGMSAVEGLRKLADELHQRGEFRVAGILNAVSLLLGAGYDAALAGMLERMTGGVVAERLCQHLDSEEAPPPPSVA